MKDFLTLLLLIVGVVGVSMMIAWRVDVRDDKLMIRTIQCKELGGQIVYEEKAFQLICK